MIMILLYNFTRQTSRKKKVNLGLQIEFLFKFKKGCSVKNSSHTNNFLELVETKILGKDARGLTIFFLFFFLFFAFKGVDIKP